MRRPPIVIVLAAAFAALVCGCGSGGWHRSSAVPSFTPREQVAATLDAFHAAAARADEATYFDLLAPDAIFMGTDPGERWTREQFREWARPYFQRDAAWTMHAVEREIWVSPRGEVAWFDEVVRSDAYGDLRGSGVLLRDPRTTRGSRERAWVIWQYNLAFMVPNDAVDAYLGLVRRARPAP